MIIFKYKLEDLLDDLPDFLFGFSILSKDMIREISNNLEKRRWNCIKKHEWFSRRSRGTTQEYYFW